MSAWGGGRTAAQSSEGIRRAASDPTSGISDFPYSGFSSDASYATLLLPAQSSVCCIDRLKPPPEADLRQKSLLPLHLCDRAAFAEFQMQGQHG